MRSIFWKGMIVFLLVILVAVGAMAAMIGSIATTQFKRYSFVYGGLWDAKLGDLAAYYAAHKSWEGLEEGASPLQMEDSVGHGMRRGPGAGRFQYHVVDATGRIVADTAGPSGAMISEKDLESSLPIRVDDDIVGFLIPSPDSVTSLPLNASQEAFLRQIKVSLWVSALAAMAAALILGGLLFRSITAPLLRLTDASQAIAEGNLETRAPVRGRDEVARLGASFNQMAESLGQAESARRNQTADVAHELRTPLTVLQGTLEAMLDGVYAPSHENLQIALAQVRTLSRLVEDLRVLARVDAGELDLHRVPVDVTSFLRQTVETYQIPAHARGISLTLDASGAAPTVQADPDRLSQVLGNLISNALRYTPEGGRVQVAVSMRRPDALVSVADDGAGIAPEDLPHVFDRFWRADSARRRATGGSGLGLTIARSLIEAHGGHIWAESAEGHGSTFTFSLPLGSDSAWKTKIRRIDAADTPW